MRNAILVHLNYVYIETAIFIVIVMLFSIEDVITLFVRQFIGHKTN